MNKVLLTALMVLMLISGANGQWGPQRTSGDEKQIKLLHERDLVVAVHEEDPKKVKNISKNPKELAEYREYIAMLNYQTKKVIDKYWQFGKKPTYQPQSLIDSWIKEKNKSYGVISFQMIDVRQAVASRGIGSLPQTGSRSPSNSNNSGIKVAHYSDAVVFSARLSEDDEYFSSVTMPSTKPSIGEMVFAVDLLQQHFNNQLSGINKDDFLKNIKQNPSFNPAKVLLLDERFVKDKKTGDALKAVYSYPLEVVPYSKIEEAILNRDNRYAYVQFLPKFAANSDIGFQYLVNAEDGKIVGYSNPVPFVNPVIKSSVIYITDRDLKNFAEFVKK